MRSIFVSASVPDPNRDKRYFASADIVAIRDAIVALVQVVTPQAQLVFGGHPAITPMVARVAEAISTLDKISIYQSAWFTPFFPAENAAFQSLTITPKAHDLKTSLDLMRTAMLTSTPFDAAFFVGGMDGVIDEFNVIRGLAGKTKCFPLATTGGAALIIAQDYRAELQLGELDDLYVSYDYPTLVRRLLRPETGSSHKEHYS